MRSCVCGCESIRLGERRLCDSGFVKEVLGCVLRRRWVCVFVCGVFFAGSATTSRCAVRSRWLDRAGLVADVVNLFFWLLFDFVFFWWLGRPTYRWPHAGASDVDVRSLAGSFRRPYLWNPLENEEKAHGNRIELVETFRRSPACSRRIQSNSLPKPRGIHSKPSWTEEHTRGKIQSQLREKRS